jgi:hypothetical protein
MRRRVNRYPTRISPVARWVSRGWLCVRVDSLYRGECTAVLLNVCRMPKLRVPFIIMFRCDYMAEYGID